VVDGTLAVRTRDLLRREDLAGEADFAETVSDVRTTVLGDLLLVANISFRTRAGTMVSSPSSLLG
jgi:hypothetical protein